MSYVLNYFGQFPKDWEKYKITHYLVVWFLAFVAFTIEFAYKCEKKNSEINKRTGWNKPVQGGKSIKN